MMKIKILIVLAFCVLLNSCKNKESEDIEYYPDGKLWKKTVYTSPSDKDQYKQYEYYKNENIKNIREYKAGIPDGRNFAYYEDGKIKSVFYYCNGKLTSVGRYYNNDGRITDKGLFINDSMVVKEEFFYQKDMVQVNVFTKKDNDFSEVGHLLYNNKGLFGLDNSFYYIASSLDSIPMGDSLKVNVDFIAHKDKKSHIALLLGDLTEDVTFTSRDKSYLSDSLSLSFYYKPEKPGYNLILGKLLYIARDPEEKVREFVFYHDFLSY